MINLDSKSYKWHPALECLRECGFDPNQFDNLISHCIELGNVPKKAIVCKYPFDTGEEYAIISAPFDVDAFFVGYKYGTLEVDVIEDPEEIATHLVNHMNDWPKITSIHKSDFFSELKLWLKLVSYPSVSDKTIGKLSGCSRAVVTNLLRLQKLDSSVRAYVAVNAIDQSKARTLASLDVETQRRLAKMCVQRDWSYRELYAYAFPSSNNKEKGKRVSLQKSADVIRFENVMSERSGLGITYDPLTESMNKGVLNIKFTTLGELSRVLDLVIGSSDSELQEGELQINIDTMQQLMKIFKKVVPGKDKSNIDS
jgi:hypothetical protein